ncbi:MAG: hypothetical protein ACFFAE_16945, partial [Candidatus Hodarchaeota archaeon]
MGDSKSQKPTLALRDKEKIILESKKGFSIFLSFLLILAGLSLTFITIRLIIANFFQQEYVFIDIPSLLLSIFGAGLFTYIYHTRYARRVLILEPEEFSLIIGQRTFKYLWSEFSLVALASAYASYGMKGYVIRLYKDDLEGDYVDIPIYRFPIKDVEAFDYRNLVQERVSTAKQDAQDTSQIN